MNEYMSCDVMFVPVYTVTVTENKQQEKIRNAETNQGLTPPPAPIGTHPLALALKSENLNWLID